MSIPRGLAGCCCIFSALLLSLGCGGGTDEFGRTMVPVKGKVTVKGEPIKANNNLFLIFQKGVERPESLEVKSDGTFSGSAVAGENLVKLHVYGPPEALGAVKQEYITSSVLKANVEAGKDLNLEVGE